MEELHNLLTIANCGLSLQKISDPVGILGHSVFEAFELVVRCLPRAASDLVSQEALSIVVKKSTEDLNQIDTILAVVAATHGRQLWMLSAPSTKMQLAQCLCRIRVDISLFLSCWYDGMISSVAAECCRLLRMHHTQLSAMVADARAELVRCLSGEHHDAKMATQLQLALRSHDDETLITLGRLLAKNESLSPRQVEVINDNFAEAVVGVMHLHQQLLLRYNRFKKEVTRHRTCSAKLNALTELRRLTPLVCETGSRLVEELDAHIVLLRVLSGALTSTAPWLQDSGSQSSGKLAYRHFHRLVDVGSAAWSDFILHERELRETMNSVKVLIDDCLATFRSMGDSSAREIISIAEALSRLSRALHSWMLDCAKEMDGLRQMLPSASIPLLMWFDTADESLLADPTKASLKSTQWSAAMNLVVDKTNRMSKHASNLLPAAHDALDRIPGSVSDIDSLIRMETNEIDDALAELKKDSVIPSDMLTSPQLLIQRVKATVDRSAQNDLGDHITSPQKEEHVLRLDDYRVAGAILTELLQSYESMETSVIRTSRTYFEIADVDAELRRCERTVATHCALVEALGKSLYLTDDALSTILASERTSELF